MAYNEITKGLTFHADTIRNRNSWIKVDKEHEYLLYENVWSDSDGYVTRQLKDGSTRYDVRLVVNGKSVLCKTFRNKEEAIEKYTIEKRKAIINGVQ